MCLPLPALAAGAATATSALSSVVNYFGTQSAHHAAVGAANLNYSMAEQQAGRQNVQLSEQASETSLTDAVQRAREFGQIATSAGDLGLGASSEHQLLSASAAGYNRTLGIEDTNVANQRANIQTNLTGASIQRSTAIASAPRTNLLKLGLDLVGAGSQGLGVYGALGGTVGIKPAASAAGGASSGMGAVLGGLY